MANIADLTAVATEIAADDSALKTAIDTLVTAYNAAQAAGFTPADQVALDAAVAGLTTAHADLAAQAADAAANPPVAP